MRISSVRAFPVQIDRDVESATGLAGSPARLSEAPETGAEGGVYRWARNYRTVYSTRIETTLVRVETDQGLTGWGEAQSPVAPQVTASVVNTLLGPLSIGEDALAPEALWDRMYAAMRVRGHTGGFLLDAVSGIDIAVWDICGKAYGQPVSRLLGGPVRAALPAYISGLAGATIEQKIAFAGHYVEQGARAFKLFLDEADRDCLDLLDALRAEFSATVEIAVDGLWRMTGKEALRFVRKLESRQARWLEAPLMPENVKAHRDLARATDVPIAIGESYRTRFELLPFFENRALDIVQPDIGRSGITEGRKIASLADAFQIPVAPHLSIGLGPQIAAAIHLGASIPNLLTMECNPMVFETANRFLRTPIAYTPAALSIPDGPGLGIQMDERLLAGVIQ